MNDWRRTPLSTTPLPRFGWPYSPVLSVISRSGDGEQDEPRHPFGFRSEEPADASATETRDEWQLTWPLDQHL